MNKIKITDERASSRAKKANNCDKPEPTPSDAARLDAAGGNADKPSTPIAGSKTKEAIGPKAAKGEHQPAKPVAAKPAQRKATKAEVVAPAKPNTTKQEQVLTLLSRKGGVTIGEVMKATGWQQHSVRGFFAGTVRKKLGFELSSVKIEGDDRRYAIKVAA
jgi:Protein of unknown function (DUF3489)